MARFWVWLFLGLFTVLLRDDVLLKCLVSQLQRWMFWIISYSCKTWIRYFEKNIKRKEGLFCLSTNAYVMMHMQCWSTLRRSMMHDALTNWCDFCTNLIQELQIFWFRFHLRFHYSWFWLWFQLQGLPQTMIQILNPGFPKNLDSDSDSSIMWFQSHFQQTKLWFRFWFRNHLQLRFKDKTFYRSMTNVRQGASCRAPLNTNFEVVFH